jgi:hypothetical protein
MGLSIRAYAKHRGVSHTAVCKALRAGRIAALPDGTIDPTVADAAWNAAAEAARLNGTRTADARRVVLPCGQLEGAAGTVEAVLEEHGIVPDGRAPQLADAQLANALLRAERQELAILERRAHLEAYYGLRVTDPVNDPVRSVPGWRVWASETAATLAKGLGVSVRRVRPRLTALVDARLVDLGLLAAEEDNDEGDGVNDVERGGRDAEEYNDGAWREDEKNDDASLDLADAEDDVDGADDDHR